MIGDGCHLLVRETLPIFTDAGRRSFNRVAAQMARPGSMWGLEGTQYVVTECMSVEAQKIRCSCPDVHTDALVYHRLMGASSLMLLATLSTGNEKVVSNANQVTTVPRAEQDLGSAAADIHRDAAESGADAVTSMWPCRAPFTSTPAGMSPIGTGHRA